MTEKLERTTAIKDLIDPMGNKWKVAPGKTYPGLYEISIQEGKPQTLPPKELRGHYTNVDRALAALKVYLEAIWDKSDAATKPKVRKPTEEASAAES